MTDKFTPSIEQIAQVMSELQNNYSELARNWFDIFYNTTPMDVTVNFFDSNNELKEYTLPNRAKDKSFIFNGEGSPEGVITANTGASYQDTGNGSLFIKQSGSSNVGWVEILKKSEFNSYLKKGMGNPEGNIVASSGVIYVDKETSILYIKTTETGNMGWSIVSGSENTLLVDGSRSMIEDYEPQLSTDVATKQYVDNSIDQIVREGINQQVSENEKLSILSCNLDVDGRADIIDGINNGIIHKYGAGSYTITIEEMGDYDIAIVGGGAGWVQTIHESGSGYYTAPGGSGAGFVGTITLQEGIYNVTVGSGGKANVTNQKIVAYGNAGGSSILSLGEVDVISAGGGLGGAVSPTGKLYNGSGGSLSNNAPVIGSPIVSANGNAGTGGGLNIHGHGGYSIYNGYGAGGGLSSGVDGFFSIYNTNGNSVNFKVTANNPLVICDLENRREISIIESISIAGMSDGVYTLFMDSDDNIEFVLTENIYIQKKEPSSLTEGTIWRDTSKLPLKQYKYMTSSWEEFNKVDIGGVTISGGAITKSHQPTIGNNKNIKQPIPTPDISNLINIVASNAFTMQETGWFLSSTGNVSTLSITHPVNLTLFVLGSLALEKGVTFTSDNAGYVAYAKGGY